MSKDTLRNGVLWRKIDVVSLQKVSTKADILRVFRGANVTRKVPPPAALEFHVGGQISLHLVRSPAPRAFDKRLCQARGSCPRDIGTLHPFGPPES